MHYHTDCGHIVEESLPSMMVSEGGWADYTHMHLGKCPVCGSEYMYMKPLDESVRSEVEHLVYRLLQKGHTVHIPPASTSVKSIRIENVEEIGIELQSDSVDCVNRYGDDLLVKLIQ